MSCEGNIVIAGKSALHFLMHADAASFVRSSAVYEDPLQNCARNAARLSAFNQNHPLYGGSPISILVSNGSLRRENKAIECKSTGERYPKGSFFKLREGLYMASPELVFLRAATSIPHGRLVELGLNLCGRYYLAPDGDGILDRSDYLTSPSTLGNYLDKCDGLRGAEKARNALKHVVANSGSPAESKTWVQYCMPMRNGGIGLAFTAMNYDIKAGRIRGLAHQGSYCVDIAEPTRRLGIEYMGRAYHLDASKDARRQNELQVLGWELYTIDAGVLYDPNAALRFGLLLAKRMGRRIRVRESWYDRYLDLRDSIGLPVDGFSKRRFRTDRL